MHSIYYVVFFFQVFPRKEPPVIYEPPPPPLKEAIKNSQEIDNSKVLTPYYLMEYVGLDNT